MFKGKLYSCSNALFGQPRLIPGTPHMLVNLVNAPTKTAPENAPAETASENVSTKAAPENASTKTGLENAPTETASENAPTQYASGYQSPTAFIGQTKKTLLPCMHGSSFVLSLPKLYSSVYMVDKQVKNFNAEEKHIKNFCI